MKKRKIVQHITRVAYGSPKRHTPMCSCGWVGPTRTTEDEAETDANDHVVAAAVEP